MRFRPDTTLRWLSGWLIAALLLAQHGATWHAIEHLGKTSGVAASAAVQSDSEGTPHELSCAKCLAYAALDHATSSPVAPVVGHQPDPAPIHDSPTSNLPHEVPPACSRGPPLRFS